MKIEMQGGKKKMVLPHERRPRPEYEPTHQEIMDKLEIIEDLLKRIERR